MLQKRQLRSEGVCLAFDVTNARVLHLCPAAGTGSGVSRLEVLAAFIGLILCLFLLNEGRWNGIEILIYSRFQFDWTGKKMAYSSRQLARPGWPACFKLCLSNVLPDPAIVSVGCGGFYEWRFGWRLCSHEISVMLRKNPAAEVMPVWIRDYPWACFSFTVCDILPPLAFLKKNYSLSIHTKPTS